MKRFLPILLALPLAACAGPKPQAPMEGIAPLSSDAEGASPETKLKVKAELRLDEFVKSVEFGMLNATQGNYVRSFPKEGFGVIVNLLPVVDPVHPGIIDAQYQVEISEEVGEKKPRARVVQLQNEFHFEVGKPQTVLESEGAKVTLTFWKDD